jgi:tetratricopeptide (TPR) repeat protein
MELYAINHRELVVPEEQDLIGLPEYAGDDIVVAPVRGQKSKWVAGGLAFFFGIFGVHRFYLGQTWRGIFYLIAFGISMLALIEEDAPFIAFLGIIAFVDAVLFFAMPWADFNYKYNTPKAEKKRKKTQRKFQHRKKTLPVPSPPRKRQVSAMESRLRAGKTAIKSGQYEQAIQALDEVLDLDETHNEAHYLLATCFSMLKDEENAFIHLGLAVKHGWKDEARIKDDIHLHYLRSRPTFDGFVQNGYKLVEALPEPKPDLLDSAFDPLVLERIEDLGEKLERGELTREEFEEEKHKILKGG